MEKYPVVALALAGLEESLKNELQELGAQDCVLENRMVISKMNDSILYKANICSTKGIKFLKAIGIFDIDTERQLYEKVLQIQWGYIINASLNIDIVVELHKSIIEEVKYVQYRIKDAICDQFKSKLGRRPYFYGENPDVILYVLIFGNKVYLTMDSTGGKLDVRHYRLENQLGQINEMLAAKIYEIIERPSNLCLIGESTQNIGLEAIIYHKKLPTNAHRKFAFEKWRKFDSQLLHEIKNNVINDIEDSDLYIPFYESKKERVEDFIKKTYRIQETKHFDSIVANWQDIESVGKIVVFSIDRSIYGDQEICRVVIDKLIQLSLSNELWVLLRLYQAKAFGRHGEDNQQKHKENKDNINTFINILNLRFQLNRPIEYRYDNETVQLYKIIDTRVSE